MNFDDWLAYASVIGCILIFAWFIWYTYNEKDNK